MKKLSDVLQITSYGMGTGDKDLALRLISNYLKLIIEDNRLPAFITFYNGGVRLLDETSPVKDQLARLEEKGVKLIACGTCLQHYQINKPIAGIKGTMADIITLQSDAEKVITL